MPNTYDVELTETYIDGVRSPWVNRATVTMPELTHYGYDGSNGYTKANKIANRELMKKAKATMGLTGVRGVTIRLGHRIEFRPYKVNQVMYITYREN